MSDLTTKTRANQFPYFVQGTVGSDGRAWPYRESRQRTVVRVYRLAPRVCPWCKNPINEGTTPGHFCKESFQ